MSIFLMSFGILHAQYPVENIGSEEVYGDFVVGPGKVELTIEPGESKTVEVMLTNRMGDEREFVIETEDIKGSDDVEQTVVLLGDDRGPYSLRDYFEIPERGLTLEHAQRARIPVTVQVPENIEPGGYYGTVLFTTVSKKADGSASDGSQGAAAIVSRIGVLFFVTVPGGEAYGGQLERFGTKNNQMFFSRGPIPLQVQFRNTGSMHLDPSGEIEIKNMLGTVVDTVRIEPWFSLPQSLRLREVNWTREVLAGRYTATLTLNRGYGTERDMQTITFWVLPWQPISIGLGSLFILVFVVRFFLSRFELKRKI